MLRKSAPYTRTLANFVKEFSPFGSQRKIGRRSDNPDIKMFGYNDNTIHIQRSVSCQSGNTKGRKDRKKAWVEVTDEPLPKRKKKKTAIVTRTG